MSAPPVHTALARNRRIVHIVWSLGWATRYTVAGLLRIPYGSVTGPLYRLTRQQLLQPHRVIGTARGQSVLYRTGPKVHLVDPGYAAAWRPSLMQAGHVLATGRVLLRLVGPVLLPVQVAEWRGEAELRAWHVSGQPLPDLVVLLARPDGSTRRWAVEVDCGTEGRGQWDAKLAAYLRHPYDAVLVVTTTQFRARQIAARGADVGVPVVAGTDTGFATSAPLVLDARERRTRRLADAALA